MMVLFTSLPGVAPDHLVLAGLDHAPDAALGAAVELDLAAVAVAGAQGGVV